MMIQPDPLITGDSVAVTAVASVVSDEVIEPGIAVLEHWGLIVHRGKHLYDRFGSFAGIDADRLHDLQQALDNPAIKAVFIARGGYGTSRVMDQLDLTVLKKHPKWVVGFSDVTALHAYLFSHGFIGVHGPMPGYYAKDESKQSTEFLRRMLFGEWPSLHAPEHLLNRLGIASGRIVGGNLAIVSHLMGTSDEVDTKGNILLLEDIGEYCYVIDRMMVQLKRAGKLQDLAGLIVGHFTKIKDTDPPFGKSVQEIIREHVEEFDFPLAFNFSIGHDDINFSVPIGYPSLLTVAGGTDSALDFSFTR